MNVAGHDRGAEGDARFLHAFENASLRADQFRHRDHVRAAWLCLQQGTLMQAIERFTTALRRFTERQGKPERYHETITWCLLLLIHERWQRSPARSWEQFADGNPDLMAWHPSHLHHYYKASTLASPFARRVFVMPDAGERRPTPPSTTYEGLR